MNQNFSSKGDRLLAGLGGARPQGQHRPESGSPSASASAVDVVALTDIIERNRAEIAEVRGALLEMGLPEDCVDAPETVDIEHFSPEDRDRYNDALREHRALEQEMSRDLQEIRSAEGAI